jgi:hypothetical protein
MTENNEVAEDATVEEIVEVTEEVVVDEIVEAEEAPAVEEIAKSDEVEVAEDTVETSVDTEGSADDASTDNGEATDLEKTLSEIKNFVGEALTKSGETNAAAVNGVVNTVAEVTKALTDKTYTITNIGVPRAFLTNYGTKHEHDNNLGLDIESLKTKILKCIQ